MISESFRQGTFVLDKGRSFRAFLMNWLIKVLCGSGIMVCSQTGAKVKMYEGAGNCLVFHGTCQPVGSGNDAETHRQGHHALSLLRERNHAPGLLDTGRIRPSGYDILHPSG